MNRYFATCPRGLEAALGEELAALGATEIVPAQGGVAFAGDTGACYRANLESRIATRLLLRVGACGYRSAEDIYRLARDVKWERWFGPEQLIRVDVTAIASPLKSLDFVVLRVKDAVCDRLRDACGGRPSVDTANPDVRIVAFLTERDATLYLDTTGEPLYKRGFKHAVVAAPLKENLAAGILRLAQWQPDEPLLDPMCGSGTFLIEAAMIALDIAPGLARRFGFEKLRDFDAALWKQLRSAAALRKRTAARLPLFGSDLSDNQIARASANLRQAGVANLVTLDVADALTLRAPADHGVLVANPPYGVRVEVEGEDAPAFYRGLGDALKQRFSGWRAYFISADTQLAKTIGLRSSRRIPLYNGGLECRLYEYRMVAGSLRLPKPHGGAAEKTDAA